MEKEVEAAKAGEELADQNEVVEAAYCLAGEELADHTTVVEAADLVKNLQTNLSCQMM